MPFTTTAIRRVVPSLALLVGVLLLAAEAFAQNNYSVNSAFWARNSGRFTNVPFVGNTINNCPDTLVPRLMTGTQAMTGATPASVPTGIAPAAPYGCPTGPMSAASMILATTAQATANGAGGAFTLPTHLISRPPYGMLVTVNLPYATNLIQAATDGRWRVPHSARAFGMTSTATDALGMPANGGPGSVGPVARMPAMCIEATCTNLAPFRRFHQSAWKGGPMSTYNGQTGRVGPNFTFCFGDGTAGTAGCTTILNGIDVANRMLVRYTAGPRGFGGTSNQLVNTTIVGSLFAKFIGGAVLLNPLNSGVGQIQVQGRGYADFLTDYLTAFTQTYMTYTAGPAMIMGPGGSFTIPSQIMMLGTPGMFPLPANYNQNYGFPLTTGTVLVRRIDMNPVVVTITGMGGDVATAGGARNISLVSGALSNLSALGNNTATFSRLILNLPEPGGASSLLAGVLALFGMAAWRARKAR